MRSPRRCHFPGIAALVQEAAVFASKPGGDRREVKMKAVVLKERGVLRVEDVPMPRPGPGEVLVRVRACGICGSDLRYFEGENPWAQHTLGEQRPNPPNIILGHEIAGEIVEAAEERDGGRLGQRVALISWRACGECYYCRAGLENLCAATKHLGHGAGWGEQEFFPGGMAELCRIWEPMARPLPENLSFEEGALMDAAGVAVHAVNRARFSLNEPMAVIGCGAIGLVILQVARLRGAGTVFCVDVADRPLEAAASLGGHPVDGRRRDAVEEVLDHTSGEGAAAVWNTVGAEHTILQGMRMLRRGGTQVLLAFPMSPISLPPALLAGERILTISANNAYAEFDEALRLAEAGDIELLPLITHTFPLEEAPEAFAAAMRKSETGAIKVILRP
jgi:threonine dehydrogenase-like Zn-dependent dehydrogenase